jgi:hypothetical protein
MTGVAAGAEVFTRIVVEDDGDMRTLFEVMLNGHDGGSAGCQSDIGDIAARRGP